jgi:hypothetical protein
MALDGTEFTTLATANAELGSPSDDTYVERIIRSIDKQMREYLGRPIMHNTTATLQPVTVLSAREIGIIPRNGPLPVTSVSAFELNENALTSTDLGIVSADYGILRYDDLLYSTSDYMANIERDLYPGLEDESALKNGYTLSWAGGWVMPGQGGTRTFPYDLEDAGLQWVAWRYARKGRDPTVLNESLMSYSVGYGVTASVGMDIPGPIKAILDLYKLHHHR